jgi:hypothetical protein
MGASIRTRLAGLGHTEDPPAPELNEHDHESALHRLAAYDPQPHPRERRRPPTSTPPLQGRAGLWRR